MQKYEKLMEVANFLDRNSIVNELEKIHQQETKVDACLILALIGEFNAGKTSLINALTDAKALETSILPTTATIYDIHFGADKNYALVYETDESFRRVEDISSLKNEKLKDSKIVSIFDTSCKVSSSTVLVDTPGLSSSNPQHREVLCKFLPNADAVLLVVDINQQITKSLTDFINAAKLAKKKLFLVVAKCDTKEASQKQKTLEYIARNCNLALEDCACVSSKNGDLIELYKLFDRISTNKKSIISEACDLRYETISVKLKNELTELSKIPPDDEKIQKQIVAQKNKLSKIQYEIDDILVESGGEIEKFSSSTCKDFENKIFDQLDSLANREGLDFDEEIQSKISCVSSIMFNNLKDDIGNIIQKAIVERQSKGFFSMNNFGSLNLNEYSLSKISYGLKLNELGHKYDGAISIGLKTVAVTIAVATTAYVAGPILLEATEISIPESRPVAADVLDSATDIGRIVSNHQSMLASERNTQRIEDAMGFQRCANPAKVNSTTPRRNDILTTVVRFVGDKTVGKPMRRKAIHAYLDDELVPQFKHQVKVFVNTITNQMRFLLNKDAEHDMNDLTGSLEKLRNDFKNNREFFENKMKQVKIYIAQLG